MRAFRWVALAAWSGVGTPVAVWSAPSMPEPKGRLVIAGTGNVVESTLTPALVEQKIKAEYVPGIRDCYEAVLKKEPVARGTVKLRFTVTESGSTVDGVVLRSFWPELGPCIATQMGTWLFPAPKDSKTGKLKRAVFTFSIFMVPD